MSLGKSGSVDRIGYSDPWVDLGIESTQAQDPERDLARFLKSLEPDDPQILGLLIGHYAPEIYRLVHALFDSLIDSLIDGLPHRESQASDINLVAQRIFARAASDLDQFDGEGGVRVWLTKVAVDSVLAYRRRRKWRQGLKRARASSSGEASKYEAHSTPTRFEQRYWAAVDGLAEEGRLCVVLRYLHHLPVPDIAHVLHVSGEQVHILLTAARRAIHQRVSGSQGQPDPGEVEGHPETRQQIQASLDGLLDKASDVEGSLNEHLSSCSACRAYWREMNQIVSGLMEALQSRWPVPDINPSDVQQFIAAARAELRKTQRSNRLLIQLRELGWYGFVIMAALAVLWHLVQVDTHVSEPLFPPTPLPPPTPIQASTGVVRGVLEGDEGPAGDISEVTFYADPSISADGNSVAFFSFSGALATGDTAAVADILVLDRQTSIIEPVSVDSKGVSGNGLSFGPSISADGRLVAFASLADNLVTGDNQTCVWEGESESSCVDIFIHDRGTGTTERISSAYDGSEADGHSFLPTISATGRWVAFWSVASNLVEGDIAVCGEGEEIHNCLDVFVYDRETGVTDRIPIGRSGEQQAGNQLITISEDGRYLAVVLSAADLAAGQIDVANQTDVFVYDRQADTFESVNVSAEGTPGNRASTGGVISADGRYVAFVSWASNLVAEDANGRADFGELSRADVFVRDRVAHRTERVSIASDGSEGNGNSGTLVPVAVVDSGWQIGISDGGRYVAFVSYADNLVAGEANTYSPLGTCNNVYVRDRQTGETELVTRGPGRGCFYSHLHISGNGRWLSLVEQLPNCPSLGLCSDLWLHDWRAGLTENLLRGKRSARLSSPKSAAAIGAVLSLRHDRAVNSVAFSPDGKTVAMGASDGIVRLWRVSDGSPLHTLEGHTRPVNDIAFIQDGTLLISGSLDRTVSIWRVSDGALLRRVVERTDEVLSLAVSPDERLVAVGSYGAAWVWEAKADLLTLLDSQEYPGSYVNSLAFSPDGTLLALALSDETVWLRRVPGGETVLRLGGHAGKVLSLAFSPDGRYLATGSEDNTLDLWRIDGEAGDKLEVERILTLEHPDWVRSLAFSPDGTMLASATLDRRVRLWSVPDGELLDPVMHTWHQVLDVAFSPDGRTLALGTVGGYLHLWHITKP